MSLTPNGAAVDLTNTGTGTHTARIKDGTVEGVTVDVWEAGGDEERVPQNAYTVARTSNDVVTLSGFAITPTSGQYEVYVMTLGRPATYQAHEHEIDETPEAKQRIEDLEARVAALEALAPSAVTLTRNTSSTVFGRLLGNAWVLPRVKIPVEKPAALIEWRNAEVDLGDSPRRPLRLLPAVIDAASEALPSPLPTPAAEYRERLFVASTDRDDVPGGGILGGEAAACDGREWYAVVRNGSESSWHPRDFEKLLFEVAITASELSLGAQLDLDFGLEAMVLMLERTRRTQRAQCSWVLTVQAGGRTAASTPGTPGANLSDGFASPVTLLSQQIILTEIPSYHTFGVTIARSAAGVLSAKKRLYGDETATSAPAAADFSIRGLLTRFDTANAPADARGIPVVRGLDVGLDGQPDAGLGKLIISK